MRNLHRIAAASGRLRKFCGVMMISLPIVCALFWTFFNQIYTSSFVPTSMIPLPVPVDGELSGLIRLLAFHVVSLGLFPADIIAAFVGAVILIIAWVMDEARLIHEDQALII